MKKKVMAVLCCAAFAGAAMLAVGSVRAAAPTGQYVVSTDTVYDSKTKLTWQRVLVGPAYNWANASSYCQGLNLGGFSSGWRLPAKKELETLVDVRAFDPAMDTSAFPVAGGRLWSSSPSWAGCHWIVDFSDGGNNPNYHDTETNLAKCVR